MKEVEWKQGKVFTKVTEERGEQSIDFIEDSGFIIPIVKETGKVLKNLKSVRVHEAVDEYPLMTLEIMLDRR